MAFLCVFILFVLFLCTVDPGSGSWLLCFSLVFGLSLGVFALPLGVIGGLYYVMVAIL